MRQRALPAAGVPHDGDGLARRDMQIHIHQRRAIAVPHRDVAQFDFAAHRLGQGARVEPALRFLDVPSIHSLDSCKRRSAALHQVRDPTHRDHGPHQHSHVGVEHHEAAERDAMLGQPQSAHPQNQQERDPDQRRQQRIEQRGNPRQAQILVDVIAIQRSNNASSALFLHVSAHHAHARQVFLHAAADVGEHPLDLSEALVDAAVRSSITAIVTSGAGARARPASAANPPSASRRPTAPASSTFHTST